MKILVCDPMESSAVERMRLAGLTVDVRDSITPDELNSVLKDYDGMVVRSRTKVRAPLIDLAPNLKVIVRGGVGLDTIDADYARSKGITVLNTPLSSSASVAELAIGFMIALARAIPATTASMRAGKWEKKKFEGDEIGGKTLGIVGIGNIGKEVAKRALALGMDVVVYDPHAVAPEHLTRVSLDDLLSQADYITFHMPLTQETRHMIDAAGFAKMKPGVRIINCARGGIVDEDALYDALVSGKVAGAALDVYAQEPCEGHKLFTLEQVIGSPHIGAATREAQQRIGAEVAEKLIEFYHQMG
ncbi:MAG: 3-phosphoglycerate dehydrogenase [Chloroflexi bacterium RBG_16_57_11]|nr:MAG: 3-phosphoglycerate dehydrogenase [Chloroflexi bacterium RBG_16_57_11]